MQGFNANSIPGQGTKPHIAAGILRPCATAREADVPQRRPGIAKDNNNNHNNIIIIKTKHVD